MLANTRGTKNAERIVRAAQVTLIAVILSVAALIAVRESHRAIFLIALALIVFVPSSYARLRLHRLLVRVLPPAALWPVVAAGLVCDAVMLAQLLTTRTPSTAAWLRAPVVTWIGPVWFSTHGIFFVAEGLARLLRLAFRWLRPRAATAERPEGDIDLGRRAVLQRAGLLGAALPFGISLSGVPLSYDFRVEERHVTLPFWPAELDGLRVGHLSDIHVGPDMNGDRLARVAELTNGWRPDMILHSGDFLTHRLENFDAPLYEALGSLRAPFGQFACLGNHDYDDVARLVRRLGEAGVRVLRNQLAAVPLRGTTLEIAGLDYIFEHIGRAAHYTSVVAGWPARSARPRILLNHDPRAFFGLPAGCADLVLSGHTHGGHVGVQLGRDHALSVVTLFGYPDQGFFARGDMRLFVTRCVGFYGYPIRIGIPPEIALLVLHAPAASAA